MSDEGRKKQNLDEDGKSTSDLQLVFPGDQEAFVKFISSVLGKPQTITKGFRGPFEIRRDDVANFHHLLDQRIKQQNEAHLIEFTAKILYEDESSVDFKSIVDFLAYNEVTPQCSVGVHLTWVYLVKFQDKDAPEKQQIEVAINTGSFLPIFDLEVDFSGPPVLTIGRIHLRINHTARTWGIDMQSLLTGHIKTLLRPVAKFKKFVDEKSVLIGLLTGITFFVSCVIGSFFATNSFIEDTLGPISEAAKGSAGMSIELVEKIDFLVDIIAKGVWPRFTFYLAGFTVFSAVLAILVGIWVGTMASVKAPSFVLLSKKAQEIRDNMVHKMDRRWKWFFGSFVIAIAANILTNSLFYLFFQIWRP